MLTSSNARKVGSLSRSGHCIESPDEHGNSLVTTEQKVIPGHLLDTEIAYVTF